MGIDFTAPAPGCCGMAGAFGFEKEKYEVSKAIGELELLPAVRQAPHRLAHRRRRLQLPRADRPGNRPPRPALAEVLQMALREATETPEGFPMFAAAPQHYPEDAWVRPHEAAIQQSMKRAGLAVAGIAAGAALLWAIARRR